MNEIVHEFSLSFLIRSTIRKGESTTRNVLKMYIDVILNNGVYGWL